MLLRVWSRGQQAGHYLKACWKCRAPGLAPSLLHQSLNFNKTASSSSAPPWRCPLLPSSIRPSPGVVSCPGSVFQPHLVYFIPYKTELFLARSLGPEIVLRHTVTNTHRLTAMHTWIQATHTQTTHTHTFPHSHPTCTLSFISCWLVRMSAACGRHCGPSSGRDLWLHVSHHLFAGHPA